MKGKLKSKVQFPVIVELENDSIRLSPLAETDIIELPSNFTPPKGVVLIKEEVKKETKNNIKKIDKGE